LKAHSNPSFVLVAVKPGSLDRIPMEARAISDIHLERRGPREGSVLSESFPGNRDFFARTISDEADAQ
jgi:hypothetical protein